MNKTGKVAIVGRPNTGKSSLFNRIIQERKSIISDQRGVTRDRIYQKTSWLNNEFILIDTGGIELEDNTISNQIKIQTKIAIDEADVIIFVVTITDDFTNEDLYIARILRNSKKKIIFVANKFDKNELADNKYNYYELGLGEPMLISAIHGLGIGDLLDEVVKHTKYEDYQSKNITFSLIGMPNTGKSSLFNKILGEPKAIVSDIEGTTRDSLIHEFSFEDENFEIIDTAGLIKKNKIYDQIEKYSVIRSYDAIEKSDVCLIVLDATKQITEQEQKIAGHALENSKSIIILVNKMDLIENKDDFIKEYKKNIANKFHFIDFAKIIFTSAIKETKIKKLINEIKEVYNNYSREIKTSVINDLINEFYLRRPPGNVKGKQLKIYYASIVKTKPPTIVLFVNDPNYLHFSYQRYLENNLRQAIDFSGTPIKMIFRKRV